MSSIWTTTPRTWPINTVITASDLNAQIRDFALGFGARDTYTPVWTSNGTAPVLGNGTSVGRWAQIGKTVFFSSALTLGTTTAIGTGAYSVSLPVASVAGGFNQIDVDALYFDSSSGGLYWRGLGIINSGASTVTRSLFVDGAGSSAGWSATVPVVPGSGDQITFSGHYEAA